MLMRTSKEQWQVCGRSRLKLHTNGVTVHLGADREAMAFEALSSVADLGKLLSGRDVIVDLRSRGRMTVRPDTLRPSTKLSTQAS